MKNKAAIARQELALLTKEELASVANLIVKNDLVALKEIAKTPGASALQVMLARICVKIIREGDMKSLDLLLNRLIGKVKDEVDWSGFQVNMPQIVVSLPSNGRELPESQEIDSDGEEKGSKARTASRQQKQGKGKAWSSARIG